MKNSLYINIYIQKSTVELLTELQRGLLKPNTLDVRAIYAIKTILASRELPVEQKQIFDTLTVGEVFERIENAEVGQQVPKEYTVEPPKPVVSRENWLRITFAGVTYLGMKYLYYGGSFPSFWAGVFSYSAGLVLYELVEYFVTKPK